MRQIENIDAIPEEFRTKHFTKVSAKNFDPVIAGMLAVTQSGTGAGVAIKGINIGGKTGTVQNR